MRITKQLTISLLTLLILIGSIVTNAEAAWFTGWIKRKQITISGSTGGAQTDYAVPVTTHYGSGSDSGIDVYLSSNSQTDFDDIRFTSSDGSTELDYYLEQKTDSDKALFWVEVPNIPVSPGTASIYIYYSNSSANTTSNGPNTFVTFEDFENTPFIFDTAGATGVSLSVSSLYSPKEGSNVGINSGSQGYKHQMDSSQSIDNTYITGSWVKNPSGGSTNENLGPGLAIYGAGGVNDGFESIMDNRNSVSPQVRNTWDYGSRTDGNYQNTRDTWYFINIYNIGNDVRSALYTEAQMYTQSPQTTTSRTDITWSSGYSGVATYNASHSVWDAFRLRKFVNPEPSITNYGSQESIPTITSATDSPDPQERGIDITFSIDWNDATGVKMLICKTDALTVGASPSCDGGEWVSNKDDYEASDPITAIFKPNSAHLGSHNYYAFVCDNRPLCSSSTSGTFTVQATRPLNGAIMIVE